jgi:ABC-type nickel/cobalt efflux system permease component RcnA/ABC-type uncharacterized transport system substrate-binding protein
MAQAHPHILVDAKATLVFSKDGAVSEIRHEWTFDEAYSAWALQGADANANGAVEGAELQAIADDNLAGLAEYEFYTYATEGDRSLAFSGLGTPRLTANNGIVTLSFSVRPNGYYKPGRAMRLAVNDPDYYVAITFNGMQQVALENAPDGCTATLEPARELEPAVAEKLYTLGADVVSLPPDLAQAMKWVQGAILVSCPGDRATGAPEAFQVAHTKAPPLGGPPREAGLPMPRTGLLGWIAITQEAFYRSLTAALGALKTDGAAFWWLGGLSFLYGVLHAAGPGHGKVVISSYVLADNSQLHRGIALSFASAILQSAVAVLLVLIAAAVLNLSSVAMSITASWIGTISYALVALLGAWLIVRKLRMPLLQSLKRLGSVTLDAPAKARIHLYGDHDRDHLSGGHNHGHDDHHHVVTPAQIRGGWRQSLSVVLAVGLRPCSGALVVLVFALSQGLMPAGIAAVFLMGLGTAITVAALATLAVSARGLTSRLLASRGSIAGTVVWGVELTGAVLVFAFGITLLLANA